MEPPSYDSLTFEVVEQGEDQEGVGTAEEASTEQSCIEMPSDMSQSVNNNVEVFTVSNDDMISIRTMSSREGDRGEIALEPSAPDEAEIEMPAETTEHSEL